MEWEQERKLQKRIFWGVIIALSLIQIPIFRIFIGPQDLYPESSREKIEHKRSVWFYKPVCDSLLLVDSLRNIKFKVIESYLCPARFLEQGYFQFFLPWTKIWNYKDAYFWNVTFEGMSIREKMGFRFSGIYFNIGDSSKSLYERRRLAWDSFETNTSHQSARFGPEIPDSVFLTVWGYRDLYVDKPTYRAMTPNEKSELSRKDDKSRGTEIVLGEMVFVKTDSVIFPKQEQELERKLFLPDFFY